MTHALEYWAFRALRWKWNRLPEGLVLRSAELLGFLAGSVLRIRRREVNEHLALAFPEKTRAWRARVARGSYAHLGREAATLFRMHRWSKEELLARVTFDGLDDVVSAARTGRGAVLLTGHIGNWELGGAAIAASGVPLDVVGKGMTNRRFEKDLFETRERLGMRVIDMMDAPKAVLRSLRSGRVVAMLADQNAHKSDLFIPFFGKAAATARGPAVFATRAGVPVFLVIVIREPGPTQRYRVTVRRMEQEPSGDLRGDTLRLLTEYAARLEDAIRSEPSQYFWQHRRWKTRPSEEQAAGG